ncbi:MAG TPA: hypothetical protein VEH51_13720 [Burkholderiales bacterium]|nr:hypothetical protein [Burkholderiales bacterium]
MELPNAAYLYTLALIAVGYVGFTAIVLILRQSIGGPLSPLDTLVARLFMSWGFMITYLSMLPVLLASFKLGLTAVWQISSAFAGLSFVVLHVGYQVLRRRITGDPTPLHLWIHTASGLALGIVLLANTALIVPAAVGAIYMAAVTLDMIQASFAFVQHFGFMIDQLRKQRKDLG